MVPMEALLAALWAGVWSGVKATTVDYVRGVSFSTVARAFSLLLAFSALVLGIVFISVLSTNGRCRSGRVSRSLACFLLLRASLQMPVGPTRGSRNL